VGTMLGIAAALGAVVGAVVSTRLPATRLRQVVALTCIVAGGFLLIRAVIGFVPPPCSSGAPTGRRVCHTGRPVADEFVAAGPRGWSAGGRPSLSWSP
jgi:hypothetical protein